jgi:hypothetical protein
MWGYEGHELGVRLVNKDLIVWLSLVPAPDHPKKDWYSGAFTSIQLDNKELLDPLRAEYIDYHKHHGEKRCSQIDFVKVGAFAETGCTIEGKSDVGVDVSGAGSTATLESTSVSETAPRADGTFGHGVEVAGGGSLFATGCTIQGNTTTGVRVADTGTSAELLDTLITGTVPRPDGYGGFGIDVYAGATLRATGCTLQGNTGLGVLVDGAGTQVELENTGILDTLESPAQSADGPLGRGIQIQEGASLTAIGCTVQRSAQIGAAIKDVGTVAVLQDTSILDTLQGSEGLAGHGIEVLLGAALTATGCTVQGNAGIGLAASDAGTVVDLASTAIVGNAFAGALATGGTLVLSGAVISDTVPDEEWGGEFGLYANDYYGPATVSLTDSTIGPHAYAAVWLDGNGSYDLERNTFSGSDGVTSGSATLHGNAVFVENGITAWDGATGLLLADNTFSDASEIAVLLDSAAASIRGNLWRNNGTDLRQQRCDGVVPLTEEDVADVPNPDVCPEGNVLTAYDLTFSTLFLPGVTTEE